MIEKDFDLWLDCEMGKAEPVADLLRPAPDGLLEAIAVNPLLNNPRNDGPELLAPARLLQWAGRSDRITRGCGSL